MDELAGVYILDKNPIEILAVSSGLKKFLEKDRIKIRIIPLSIIKKDIKNPALKKKLDKAEIILNKSLLDELRKS